MAEVVIFGTGGYAEVASVYLQEDSEHEVVAFTAHDRYVERDELLGRPVVAFEGLLDTHPPDRVKLLVATGFKGLNRQRRELYEASKALGYEFITYVSSRAHRYGSPTFGENTFVFEANVIQPFVTVGDNVVLWSGNHVGHHSTIEDHVFIASHAVISGNVTIGESSFVGVNATFRDGITVAPRSLIGAHAVILRDTVEGGVYAARSTPAHEKKSWELDF